MRNDPGFWTVAVYAVMLAAGATAARGQSYDLDRGFPTEVIDAYPAEHQALQVQTLLRYENTDGGGDRVLLEPEVQYGFAPNWHVEASIPILAGNADRTGSGDFRVAALWNFLPEDDAPVALAVEGQLTFPTGRNTAGIDPMMTLAATKTLSTGESQDRLHANLGVEYNAGNDNDERQSRWVGIIGYSRVLDERTVLVFDLIREQERQEHQDETILEAGATRELDDQWTVAGGLGIGLGDDSPRFRLQVGVQWKR
jgi:hypothetical protein